MRRVRDRRKHLGCANIRSAKHSDFAIRIRQRCRPFDSVVPVIGLVLEGVPLALGRVAPAHIFKYDHISARRALQAKINAVVLVVRRALQQDRKFSVGLGPKDVRLERDAIMHFHFDVTFIGNSVLVGSEAKSAKNHQGQQC